MNLPRRRSSALLLVLAALGPAPGCGGETTVTDEDPPPSVILISLDTLRADHMSLYGYERETTPYLSRLAEECLVFDRAHSVSPWTLISHVSMLTGLYPEQHGVVSKQVALSPKIPFLAQRLKDRGYRTIGLYKPGWIGPRYGHDRGFDVFEPHEKAPLAGEHLAQAFADLPEGWPFFLFLHLFDIHNDTIRLGSPLYDTPAPFDSAYVPDARARLVGVDFRGIKEGKPVDMTPEQHEALIALYDGKIRYVDSVLEEWIEGWRASGRLEDTLLVITADHGENLGKRSPGKLNGHGRMFEEGLHIPLLVRFPDGYRAGEREDALVSLVDVAPTILQTAELDPDPRLPGIPLRDELPEDRTVGAQKGASAHIQWPWKLSMRGNNRHLVNLEEDPGEQERIWPHDEVFQRVAPDLERSYQAVLDSCVPFDAPPIPAIEANSEELERELEALGYAGED